MTKLLRSQKKHDVACYGYTHCQPTTINGVVFDFTLFLSPRFVLACIPNSRLNLQALKQFDPRLRASAFRVCCQCTLSEAAMTSLHAPTELRIQKGRLISDVALEHKLSRLRKNITKRVSNKQAEQGAVALDTQQTSGVTCPEETRASIMLHMFAEAELRQLRSADSCNNTLRSIPLVPNCRSCPIVSAVALRYRDSIHGRGRDRPSLERKASSSPAAQRLRSRTTKSNSGERGSGCDILASFAAAAAARAFFSASFAKARSCLRWPAPPLDPNSCRTRFTLSARWAGDGAPAE